MPNLDNSFFIISVSREGITRPDPLELDSTIATLKLLVASFDEECSALTFDGYDEDPRPMWQVPEACAFCERVMREAPEYLKISDPKDTWALLLFATARKTATGKWVVNPEWECVLPNFSEITLMKHD